MATLVLTAPLMGAWVERACERDALQHWHALGRQGMPVRRAIGVLHEVGVVRVRDVGDNALTLSPAPPT